MNEEFNNGNEPQAGEANRLDRIIVISVKLRTLILIIVALLVLVPGIFVVLRLAEHKPEAKETGPLQANRKTGRSVILAIIDCWRNDYFSPEITPVIWRLSENGMRFTNHYVNSGYTSASMASILASQHPEFKAKNPQLSGLERFGKYTKDREGRSRIPANVVTLPQVLSQNGWKTVLVTGNPNIINITKDTGHWKKTFQAKGLDGCETITNMGLYEKEVAVGPLFLYLHYIDAHCVYNGSKITAEERRMIYAEYQRKPNTTSEAYRLALREYKNALKNVDADMARLVNALDDNTVLIITADHGELFGEDNLFSHGGDLPETIVHVPLVLYGAGIPRVGEVDILSEGVDIAPTILGLTAGAVFDGFVGRNLLAKRVKEKDMVISTTHRETALITKDRVQRSTGKLTEAEQREELRALGYLN